MLYKGEEKLGEEEENKREGKSPLNDGKKGGERGKGRGWVEVDDGRRERELSEE
jgi:hypothetical protein